MRHNLIMGIVNIIVGLILVIACFILNRTERIACAFFTVAVGLGHIAAYISERREDKRKLAEFAKKLGIKQEE